MSPEQRVERGIYRQGAAGPWRIYVSINGHLVARRLPADWTLTKVRRTRNTLDVQLRAKAAADAEATPSDALVPAPGTFAQDVLLYLQAVKTMPTFKGRKVEIGRWLPLFHDRPRASIKPIEIDVQLEAWLAEGYAGSTVKKWRTALMHLWSRLDGKGAPNPVKSTKAPAEAESEARALPDSLVRFVLYRLMRPSPTRARLALMFHLGLAPKQIANLQPGDLLLDATTPCVFVRARKKGKGVAGFAKPLDQDGVAALRAFRDWDAFGAYSSSSANKAWKVACRKIGLGGVKAYDLRHTYVTALYAASGDLRATQIASGHRSLSTTARYALGAVDLRARAAVAAMETYRAGLPPGGMSQSDK